MLRFAALSWLILLASCTCATPQVCECTPDSGAAALAVAKPATPHPQRQEPTSATPHVTAMELCDAHGLDPLDAARGYYDAGEFEKALSCASQACAVSPHEVLAQIERGNALAALNRDEEAKLAFAWALAIEPESLDALYAAAHFYAEVLPSAHDVDTLGSLYAERGFDLATSRHDAEFTLEFAALSAVALNDTGLPTEALERADFVLRQQPTHADALYEKGLALFELCRFDEAHKVFEMLIKDPDRAAHAHFHLGLILERAKKDALAKAHFDKARELAPDDFSEPVAISAEDFKAELQKALQALPEDMQRDVKGVPVEAEDLPAQEDLTSSDPILSPTILGLFRGPPLGESCEGEPTPCRSVAVYRKNLARAVHSREELLEQLRVTLLHEIGHLRGEDDEELAARGLE